MSVPNEIIQKLTLSSALTLVSTAIEAVPRGKYILRAGTLLGAGLAALGTYFWGGTVWKWITGNSPVEQAAPGNVAPKVNQQTPPVNLAAKVNQQPSAVNPPPIVKAQPQVKEQPEKYFLLLQEFKKDLNELRAASSAAWNLLCQEQDRFFQQHQKKPYAFSDSKRNFLLSVQKKAEMTIDHTFEAINTLAARYKQGTTDERLQYDAQYEKELQETVDRMVSAFKQAKVDFTEYRSEIVQQEKDESEELKQKQIKADAQAKELAELRAKLAALNKNKSSNSDDSSSSTFRP